MPDAERSDAGSGDRTLWLELGRLLRRHRRSDGWLDAVRMSTSALRALRYRAEHRRLFALPAHRHFSAGGGGRLFHVSHRHYLARGLSLPERIGCALCHYGRESARMDDAFLHAVYAGAGLAVWSETRGGVAYRIVLRANRELPHEGGSGIELRADDAVLGEIGWSWVGPALFGDGAPAAPVLFIVRNQSLPPAAAALARFRTHFPQHSPRFLCLAAVAGIALAHGCDAVVGIGHREQIAYDEAGGDGFRNSYTLFWQSFAAAPLQRLGWRLAIPLPMRELSSVASRHRGRAAERRMVWSRITRETQAAVRAHLRQPAQPPP